MNLKLNQNGCPSHVCFCILEMQSNSIVIINNYASIKSVQQYLDLRCAKQTYMECGFPAKCRFYPMSTRYPSLMHGFEKWSEGLTLKELEEYLDA
ncbi:hypothetical protein CPT_Metamorpho_239 [Klebsiella phage Metamorpho]|nr:hypothetical protein CPT_Metamorpho_239 [Klebsiella phage Metamorpho]